MRADLANGNGASNGANGNDKRRNPKSASMPPIIIKNNCGDLLAASFRWI